MPLKLIFIGDIVGSSGRKALRTELPRLREEFQADLVIANGENAAHGFGLTNSTAREIFEAGVDFITGGNHTFDKKEVEESFERFSGKIIRPANYPPGTSGRGWGIVDSSKGERIAIINLMGRVFMDPLDCPFRLFNQEYERLRAEASIVIVDFHAEATSEKYAMAWHLDGRASACVGTHTHVQTADEHIFPQGLGYISDLGMTGASDSIIGMKKEKILYRFLTKKNVRMEVAEGPAMIQGAVLSFDTNSGKCLSIERIQRTP